ncbi:MAG: response regulator [Thermoanaerobaculia bacterium]
MRETSLYRCAWCESSNDVVSAEWCSCIAAERTLLCDDCGRCFCEANTTWRREFFGSDPGKVFRTRARTEQLVTPRLTAVANELKRPVILVVDDDKVVHFIARRVLSAVAGTLVHAEDGEEGLRLAFELQPDVIITDALLPKLDGRELARTVKMNPDTSHCRVAVMTALYKGLRYRREAMTHFQADEYLEKPISAAKLLAVTERLLNQTVGDQIHDYAVVEAHAQ